MKKNLSKVLPIEKQSCLQASFTELFHRNFKFLRWIFCTLNHPFIDTPKPTFSNHDRAAEVLRGRFQLRNCEYSEVAGSLRETRILVPPHGLCARIRDILGIQLRSRSLHFTISKCCNCALRFILFFSNVE